MHRATISANFQFGSVFLVRAFAAGAYAVAEDSRREKVQASVSQHGFPTCSQTGAGRFEGTTRAKYLKRLRHRRWCAQFTPEAQMFVLVHRELLHIRRLFVCGAKVSSNIRVCSEMERHCSLLRSAAPAAAAQSRSPSDFRRPRPGRVSS